MSVPTRKRLVVLGATGSVGRQTLEVLRAFPDELELVGASAGRQAVQLDSLVGEFAPPWLAVADSADTPPRCPLADARGARVLTGPDAASELIRLAQPDMVVVATVGIAGLLPTLAALELGADVALANKEVLVCAGAVVSAAAARSGSRLLPVDSEHNAIFQCLEGNALDTVRRIILTASGGPFRTMPPDGFAAITPQQALRHPRWEMGAKITIDSATMMNKGFEVIEAHWLFGLPADRIDVVIHPQSCIHSMVEFCDGSVLAQLGPTDMRLPIQHCLFHPERRPAPHPPLDFVALGRLEFEAVDAARFPCLDLARRALATGGTAPAVLNAANEVAVSLFLEGRLSFPAIAPLIEGALDAHPPTDAPAPDATLEEILAADAWARRHAHQACLTH